MDTTLRNEADIAALIIDNIDDIHQSTSTTRTSKLFDSLGINEARAYRKFKKDNLVNKDTNFVGWVCEQVDMGALNEFDNVATSINTIDGSVIELKADTLRNACRDQGIEFAPEGIDIDDFENALNDIHKESLDSISTYAEVQACSEQVEESLQSSDALQSQMAQLTQTLDDIDNARKDLFHSNDITQTIDVDAIDAAIDDMIDDSIDIALDSVNKDNSDLSGSESSWNHVEAVDAVDACHANNESQSECQSESQPKSQSECQSECHVQPVQQSAQECTKQHADQQCTDQQHAKISQQEQVITKLKAKLNQRERENDHAHSCLIKQLKEEARQQIKENMLLNERHAALRQKLHASVSASTLPKLGFLDDQPKHPKGLKYPCASAGYVYAERGEDLSAIEKVKGVDPQIKAILKAMAESLLKAIASKNATSPRAHAAAPPLDLGPIQTAVNDIKTNVNGVGPKIDDVSRATDRKIDSLREKVIEKFIENEIKANERMAEEKGILKQIKDQAKLNAKRAQAEMTAMRAATEAQVAKLEEAEASARAQATVADAAAAAAQAAAAQAAADAAADAAAAAAQAADPEAQAAADAAADAAAADAQAAAANAADAAAAAAQATANAALQAQRTRAVEAAANAATAVNTAEAAVQVAVNAESSLSIPPDVKDEDAVRTAQQSVTEAVSVVREARTEAAADASLAEEAKVRAENEIDLTKATEEVRSAVDAADRAKVHADQAQAALVNVRAAVEATQTAITAATQAVNEAQTALQAQRTRANDALDKAVAAATRADAALNDALAEVGNSDANTAEIEAVTNATQAAKQANTHAKEAKEQSDNTNQLTEATAAAEAAAEAANVAELEADKAEEALLRVRTAVQAAQAAAAEAAEAAAAEAAAAADPDSGSDSNADSNEAVTTHVAHITADLDAEGAAAEVIELAIMDGGLLHLSEEEKELLDLTKDVSSTNEAVTRLFKKLNFAEQLEEVSNEIGIATDALDEADTKRDNALSNSDSELGKAIAELSLKTEKQIYELLKKAHEQWTRMHKIIDGFVNTLEPQAERKSVNADLAKDALNESIEEGNASDEEHNVVDSKINLAKLFQSAVESLKQIRQNAQQRIKQLEDRLNDSEIRQRKVNKNQNYGIGSEWVLGYRAGIREDWRGKKVEIEEKNPDETYRVWRIEEEPTEVISVNFYDLNLEAPQRPPQQPPQSPAVANSTSDPQFEDIKVGWTVILSNNDEISKVGKKRKIDFRNAKCMVAAIEEDINRKTIKIYARHPTKKGKTGKLALLPIEKDRSNIAIKEILPPDTASAANSRFSGSSSRGQWRAVQRLMRDCADSAVAEVMGSAVSPSRSKVSKSKVPRETSRDKRLFSARLDRLCNTLSKYNITYEDLSKSIVGAMMRYQERSIPC